jgi:hypothetical protein
LLISFQSNEFKIASISIATVSYFSKYKKTIEKIYVACLSKTLFGIECLGCGFKVFREFFEGAFKMYPAIFTTLFF